MYDIAVQSSAKKDIKRLDISVRNKVKEEILDILRENPESGEELLGALTGIRSYHFEHNKVQYRIAYTIEENTIYILMIAKRENFYDILKRKL
ncbi:MAG: type II toxin-antitoxin system mRNA interferase toxin, RelE/StbE family [Candidatus Brocadiae bacterium]|nr:type II toxin-antitoxin system mRNA interferase toxin, RelE/StbE family [Candidatus Brocadiia bacterium]